MDEAEYCDRLGLIYRGELIALGTPGRAEDRADARKRSWRSLCERPQDAMEADRAAAGGTPCGPVRQGAARGGGTGGRRRSRLSLAKLADSGVSILRSRRRSCPSLEDVFVSLIEARDRRKRRTGVQAIRREFWRFCHTLPKELEVSVKYQRIKAVAKKEFLHVLRDPRSLGMGIAMPMLLLFLFGYALTLDVDKVPLVVWDQSGTPASRESHQPLHRLALFLSAAVYRQLPGDRTRHRPPGGADRPGDPRGFRPPHRGG